MRIITSLAVICSLNLTTPLFGSDELTPNSEMSDEQGTTFSQDFRVCFPGYSELAPRIYTIQYSKDDSVTDVKKHLLNEVNVEDNVFIRFFPANRFVFLPFGNFYENFQSEVDNNEVISINLDQRSAPWAEDFDINYSKQNLTDYPFMTDDSHIASFAAFTESLVEAKGKLIDALYANNGNEVEDYPRYRELSITFHKAEHIYFRMATILLQTYERGYYITEAGERIDTIPVLPMLKQLSSCPITDSYLPLRESDNDAEQRIIDAFIDFHNIATPYLQAIFASLGF